MLAETEVYTACATARYGTMSPLFYILQNDHSPRTAFPAYTPTVHQQTDQFAKRNAQRKRKRHNLKGHCV